MKFRDGMWLVAEGKRPEYAEDVYSITQHPAGNALSLLCPTKKILERSDTLNMPTLTIVSRLLTLRVHMLTPPGHSSSI
jgi:alpha-D-xyloside xylohydrolase